MAIAKRKDVSPKEGQSKYGNVTYADETNKKYPLDSEEHIRAAWSYINMPKNAAKYSSGDLAKIKGKIRAAMKRIGATIESALVSASATQPLDGQTPDSIVYLPKGKWNITPTVNGKPEAIEVMVDADTATVLQENLIERQRDSVRPHGGFDHRPGPASFLPKQFRWDNERGVVLEVDWTKSGKEAVEGRDYSYFSPTFLLKEKKVVGLPGDGEIGSLTNNPAFRKIQRIAASADLADANNGDNIMSKVSDKLVELQVITAQQAEDGDEDFLIRAITGMHDSLALVSKANDMLKAENTDLQLKVQAVRATEADGVIQAAVAEGKIPPKDEATIQFFKEQYLAHPEQTKKVLAALQGTTALGKPIIDIKKDSRVVGSQDLIMAQKAVIAEIRENNPNLSFDTAFNKAKVQRPELFIEA